MNTFLAVSQNDQLPSWSTQLFLSFEEQQFEELYPTYALLHDPSIDLLAQEGSF